MQDKIKDRLSEANDKILEAKKLICLAEYETMDIDELMILKSVKQKIQAGANEIKNTLYPKEEFDEAKWLARRDSKDAEHYQRVQKILDDAVATGAYNDGEGKPTINGSK